MQLLIERDGHSAVAESVRAVLARLRDEIAAAEKSLDVKSLDEKSLDEKSLDLALDGLFAAVDRHLRQSLRYSLIPLINATGVILHTNLGRAPLAVAALDHVLATAGAYSNLEFDASTGERGKRDIHVDRLFKQLVAEDRLATTISTIVVNNNAAAVLLALNSLAEGGEVIVSRGELEMCIRDSLAHRA